MKFTLGEGLVFINMTETIDTTPSNLVTLSGIVLTNESATDSYLPLEGGTVSEVDSPVVTVQLTETQRVLAIEGSNTTGGDGKKLAMQIDANAPFDFAGNGMLAADGQTYLYLNLMISFLPLLFLAS